MKQEQKEIDLFGNEAEWKKEWEGMPEFIQEKTDKPYAQITFRFANEEDLKDFAKIIGQKLTNKTKSAWHPQIERGINANKIYVYES
jgi:hypothetical protein